VGAETYTTPTSPASRSATGTLTAPNPPTAVSAPAQREHSGIHWIANAAPTDATTPRVSRPEPRMRQLMGVCGWAAVLGGVGLILGIRGLFGVLAGNPPGWFEPSLIATGTAGIGLTVAAFLTVHRARSPYLFLGGASLVLIIAMALTSNAF
jgi:hypothetical protein